MSFASFPASLPYFEELHNKALLDKLIDSLSADIVQQVNTLEIKETQPFMEAFEKTANTTKTHNGALTNATTRDSIIDFYYGIQAVNLQSKSDKLFKQAWQQDPDMALHIMFYARSIHRGKSSAAAFFKVYTWLLKHHPRTALANLHVLIDGTVRTGAQLAYWRKTDNDNKQAEEDGWDTMEFKEKYQLLERRDFKTHGCWKDLCTLLTIYCQGELDGPTELNYKALQWPRKKFDKKNYYQKLGKREDRYKQRWNMTSEEIEKEAQRAIEFAKQLNEERKHKAQQERRQLRQQRQETVGNLLKTDNTYRALHFTIACLFADQLKKDMKQMEKNQVLKNQNKLKGKYALGFNLSLAAKWAPSLAASHDKHTLLATSIAEALFPPQEYQGKDETREHYVNKVREWYRKQYLVPLRNALDITEHYMQENMWDKVDISHIPSVCLEKNMKLFFKYASNMVVDYMELVALGKKKVSGETLGPHQLVYRVRMRNKPTSELFDLFSITPELEEKYKEAQEQLVNGQWKTLIKSLRDTSLLQASSIDESKKAAINLGECMAVCDVSGSMKYNRHTTDPELMPLNAAIGLSLIITNLAKPPFKGAMITFSKEPKAYMIDTEDTFTNQVRKIIKSPMGYNTDIAKVFTDVLLPMAKKHNIAPDDMVKKLFIFSDMEFDAPHGRVGVYDGTTQEFIRQQFAEAGYKVPELVWWNLCADGTYSSFSEMNAPVTKDDVDVCLLSGFSASMLKTFLDGEMYDGSEKYDDFVDLEDEKIEGVEKEKEEEKDTKEKRKETVMDFVRRAVYHKSFEGLIVVD